MTLGIINYGMGNLMSVSNAFASLGASPRILEDPAGLRQVDRIVLPGVGAFGDGMANLRAGGWIPVLEEVVLGEKKLFLGLCLGMQLLADQGTEHGQCTGLGWIPGVVRRLVPSDASIRVPHMGWNDLEIIKATGLYRGVIEPVCYFVHSYIFDPKDPSVVSARCTHGEEFTASLETQNIFATQYHPEKSQKSGLAVLRNFLSLPAAC
jgi:glutamine amidotransferase